MIPSFSLTPYLNRFSNFSTVGFWNSIIREAVNQGHSHKALILYRQMKQNGVEPNNFTFPFVAKACSKLSYIRLSQMVHTHVVKSSFQLDVFVQTAVVDMYVKCSQFGVAYTVFEKMTMRDVAAWNSMIVGFAQSGFLDKVLCLFFQMMFSGIRPDTVTVLGLTQVSSHSKNVKLLKAIHSLGIQIGLEADISLANTWIGAYAKCGDLDLAKVVFDRVDLGVRTVVSWNSMIAAYSNFEKFHDAINCYKQMLCDGYRADSSSVVSLLSSCAQPEALLQARLQFDNMPYRTCVSWTVIISGYAEKGDLDEALRLFHSMEAAGEKPDLVTMLSLISGFGQTGALELGKWIDSYAFSNGLRHNTVVCNALIDMYAKCGSMNDARELFFIMPEKTLVSWTTMISGCALNGEVEEAFDLFNTMLTLGMKPNHITFLAVLQACTHSGILEKGMEYFDMMTNEYFIDPGLDHYSCMVDLFGRKGRIKEALELVQKMPVKPDVGIWSSLLSSCKIHRNVEIGEYISDRLFKLDPLVAVPYVEMASIYASDQRWDDVAAIRKMMKSNKTKKFPGQSIVQVNGNRHVFGVENRGHSEDLFIYEVLDTLILQLKEEACSAQSEINQEHELT
ncbi:pentatricopeptide repeat-containing protein At4g19191, mitochondrial isoform X2 [Humulus lupulus]|uniref:pentatricopeptide repeat-containing protein At4g19191, mitochondrial isoform X2 n=1 Tax=Humulus lupulus TaxID=3486 RepID=UPI002B40B449|nr:pentatricopeptide repeat-containing protein At4g19191, mitochondrial isoform X2 [Humulus lupulus]